MCVCVYISGSLCVSKECVCVFVSIKFVFLFVSLWSFKQRDRQGFCSMREQPSRGAVGTVCSRNDNRPLPTSGDRALPKQLEETRPLFSYRDLGYIHMMSAQKTIGC